VTIFSDITPELDPSVRETKHYEQDVEPDGPNEPLTTDESAALDKRLESDQNTTIRSDQQPSTRAQQFTPPGEWIHPVQEARQRNAMLLPSVAQINDLNQRISSVLRFDGAPKEVATLAQKARVAAGAAREAHESGRHPDSPRYASSQAAKDAVIQEIAKATTAVAALEQAASREDVRDAWFDGLTANLEDQRNAAAAALDKAAKTYSVWRQSIAAADALAKEQGRWGMWHHHPEERELNPLGLIGEVRKARDIAQSEDGWISGRYLYADETPEGQVPEWTMAWLKDQARRAPGTFADHVYMRLLSVHEADGAAQDTIASRDLRIINTRPVPNLLPKRDQD